MDLENTLDKKIEIKRYGQIEVPNIKIFGMQYNTEPNIHWEKLYTYECNTVEGYYEEYDSNTGWTITFSTQVFSSDIYDILINHSIFWVELEEIVRDQVTGQDSKKTRLLRNFNHFSVKHKLYCDGEPTVWYITLSYKQRHCYQLEKKSDKNKSQPIKKHKELRKVRSNTLSNVQL